MLEFSSVMVGTMQTEVMAAFYKKVFERDEDMNDGGFHGWLVGKTFFTVGEHSEMGGMSKDPGRIILNFETKDVKVEFDRLVKIGATVIKEPYEMGGAWIATLADPDGNYFQLMTPWDEMQQKPK